MPTVIDPRNSYRPYGKALDLFSCRDAELLLSGPAGTGKSRACLEKMHLCAMKYPGMRGLIVRKTRSSLSESALVTYENCVLVDGSPICEGAGRAHRMSYTYPNGSQLVVGGLDRPSRIMSTEFDLAYVQEAIEITEEDWELLSTRMRYGHMPYQQIIADTNPGAPSHWLKQRADTGRLTLYETWHEDNPTVTESYLARLDKLTGARLQRLRYGRWVQAEGIVYENWDPEAHLLAPDFPIPPHWTRYRVVDFGYTNPFVCQWWAQDGDGRLYLYRELYRTQRTVRDHAQEIKRLSYNEKYAATITDHDAEDRATLLQEGIYSVPAIKAVTTGIQAVTDRLKIQGDGRPRLFILRDSLVDRDESLVEAAIPYCTPQEFDGYIWANPPEGHQPKEEPIKLHDHGMDALRYMVAHVDLGLPELRFR